MLIVLIAKKDSDSGFGLTILEYFKTVYYSELLVPNKLRKEIFIFLKEENHALATTFEDEVFLTHLAYLCNIFAKLNHLNISLQGKDTHLLQLHDQITAF